MDDQVVRSIRPLPQPRELGNVRGVEFAGDTPADLLQAATHWVAQHPNCHIGSIGWEDKAAHPEPGWSRYILTIYYET